jgi:hypothetical protein
MPLDELAVHAQGLKARREFVFDKPFVYLRSRPILSSVFSPSSRVSWSRKTLLN